MKWLRKSSTTVFVGVESSEKSVGVIEFDFRSRLDDGRWIRRTSFGVELAEWVESKWVMMKVSRDESKDESANESGGQSGKLGRG